MVAGVAPPALDLVGDVAVCEREDLEATRVGDDRPVPVHEPVEAAELSDVLVAWPQVEVEGVSQDHLVAERGHFVRVQPPYGSRRRQRDERGRRDVAVRSAEPPGPGGSVTRLDLEFEAGGVGPHPASLRAPTSLRRSPRSIARPSARRSRCGAACAPRASGSSPRGRHLQNQRRCPRPRRPSASVSAREKLPNVRSTR